MDRVSIKSSSIYTAYVDIFHLFPVAVFLFMIMPMNYLHVMSLKTLCLQAKDETDVKQDRTNVLNVIYTHFS